MPDEYRLPTETETLSADYWFPKFIISTLLFLACPLFLNQERPLSIIVSAILVIGGLLLLSLTRIKPEAEVMKYRRFFHWKSEPYSEITGCSTFWILGLISTKRYIFPLGLVVLPSKTGHIS